MSPAKKPVDWSKLEQAYGSAGSIPNHIADLASTDADTRGQAYSDLVSTIAHQGTRYSASAPAIPLLLELLDRPDLPDKHRPLYVIAILVGGLFGLGDGPYTFDGKQIIFNGKSWPRKKRLPYPEELPHWRDCYRAAESGLLRYETLLVDKDHRTRNAAANLLALFRKHADKDGLIVALRRCLDSDSDEHVRATAAWSLANLAPGRAEVRKALVDHLESKNQSERPLLALICAISLLYSEQERAPERAVTIFAEWLAHADEDAIEAFEEWAERDGLAEMGQFIGAKLAAAAARPLLPALRERLSTVEDSHAFVWLTHAALHIVCDGKETKRQRSLTSLTEEQREFLQELTELGWDMRIDVSIEAQRYGVGDALDALWPTEPAENESD
jgi:hypothetical protein